MIRIIQNIRYKMRIHFTFAAWYLVIYLISMLLVSYLLIKTSVISASDGGLLYRIWGSVIFQFAISIRFKEDFDFLLTLSNTRKNIYYSFLGVMIGFSAFFSALIVLERLIVDHLNQILGYHNISDFFHFVAPYTTDNLFLQFVFFLILCISCCLFGLLVGSLFYRFGKKFTLAFWLVFSSIPAVIFPLFMWSLHQRGQLSVSITAAGEFLRNFNLLATSGVLLLLAIIFGAAAYLNIRRLPQK
jgi:hypothetical protein